jgi:hypothetical protein
MQNLLTALCSASAEITNPKKDSNNPHFRTQYASLESVLDAVMGPLQKHGLVLMQTLTSVDQDMQLDTILFHAKSGENIRSTLRLSPQKKDPQGYAAACTYYRRLSIKAMLGLAEVDDDGNEASEPPRASKPAAKPAAKPEAKPTPAAVQMVQQHVGGQQVDTGDAICELMENCTDIDTLLELAERAKQLPPDEKEACRQVYTRRRKQLTGN